MILKIPDLDEPTSGCDLETQVPNLGSADAGSIKKENYISHNAT